MKFDFLFMTPAFLRPYLKLILPIIIGYLSESVVCSFSVRYVAHWQSDQTEAFKPEVLFVTPYPYNTKGCNQTPQRTTLLL